MPRLISRPFQPGDEGEIVALYNLITGRDRTVEQHQWEWLENPNYCNSMWVIVDKVTNKIVGHHGLLPIKLSIFGKTYLAGKTENTILHPDYKSGIYFLFEKRFFEEAKKTFDLLYTTSSYGVPRKIRERLGYQVVGKDECYLRLASFRGFLFLSKIFFKKFKLPEFLAYLISPLYIPIKIFSLQAKRLSSSHGLELKVFGSKAISPDLLASLAECWKRNHSKHEITIDRSVEYFNWRIFQNPYLSHRVFTFEDKGEVLGYAIFSVQEKMQVKKGVLIDLFAKNDCQQMLSSLMHKGLRVLRAEDVSVFSATTLGSGFNMSGLLKNLGFLPVNQLLGFYHKLFYKKTISQPTLLATIFNPKINLDEFFNGENWYYNELFSEGISW